MNAAPVRPAPAGAEGFGLGCRALSGLLAAVLSSCGGDAPSTAAAAPAAMSCPQQRPDASALGLELLDEKQLSPRLREYTLRTDAFTWDTQLRVLFPENYDEAGSTCYPVLYLLHGGYGSYVDWTESGDAERLTAGSPFIVVMPDGGEGGWYTNWANYGAGGPPMWETYHIEQLLPWIDARLRTSATRAGRAIAGLSMGGFGTMSYAARYPDLFSAAASFSGAVDTDRLPVDLVIFFSPMIHFTTPARVFGAEELNWKAHNPKTLATNLRDMRLWMYTGNSMSAGPLDPPGAPPPALTGDMEFEVRQMNIAMHEELERLGIAHTFVDYGPGSHTWPYWKRSLEEVLPQLADHFRRSAPRSAATFKTVADRYAIQDWTVEIARLADEFSTLEYADASGFSLVGSGSGVVTSPPLYDAGQNLKVTVQAEDVTPAVRTLRADPLGRLRIDVPLGPANAQQQYSLLGQTRTFRTTVRIDP